MRRSDVATLGAILGAGTGAVLLVLTHPTAASLAYFNDAYRAGASAGYIARYVALGIAAALLVRLLLEGSRTGLAALGLVAVAAAAILPAALHTTTPDEQRRVAAVAIDNPEARHSAQVRADAIRGCADGTRSQLQNTPGAKKLKVDDYCTCFIDAVIAGPQDDMTQLQAMADTLRTGHITRRLRTSAASCVRQAQ